MIDNYNMLKNNYPGKLITFCGLDGCGKTSIIKKISEDLKGKFSVCLTKQPTDFVRRSDIFRTYMDTPDHKGYDYRSLSLLAAADRIQHVSHVILPELKKGNIVISDRYFYSCLANLRARGYIHDKWIYEIAGFMIEPDAAFFLDASVDTAISRVRQRESERDRYIDVKLQHSLRKEYVDICSASKGILISTEIPFDESYRAVKKTVEQLLTGR